MWLDTALCCVLTPPATKPDGRVPGDGSEAEPSLQVAYTPLNDAVAFLDTSGSEWVMYLDSDSPPQDYIWALFEALEIVGHAGDTAPTAAPIGHLRLVADQPEMVAR